MPERIKFPLDENVSNAVAEDLRRREIDVTTTPKVNLTGITDEAQVAFALAQQRIIFTQDDDFVRLYQASVTHAGIAYCHQCSRSIADMIRASALLWEWVEPEDMVGQVEFI